MSAPRVHVIVPHPLRCSAPDVAAFAACVEECGLAGVAVGDHLAGRVPLAHSTLVLTAAATATRRIALGYGVMVLALRPVAWAAKEIATLQLLSGGRVILGVGTGGAIHGTAAWDAVGVPFEQRGPRTDAALDVLDDLVAGRPTTLPGGSELTLEPGAEPPPLWVGGVGPAARRRAAARGATWYPSMITAEQLGADRPAGVPVAVGGSARVGADPDGLVAAAASGIAGYGVDPEVARRLPLSGTLAQVAERIDGYGRAGARDLVLGLIGDDWRAQCELLAQVAEALR